MANSVFCFSMSDVVGLKKENTGTYINGCVRIWKRELHWGFRGS